MKLLKKLFRSSEQKGGGFFGQKQHQSANEKRFFQSANDRTNTIEEVMQPPNVCVENFASDNSQFEESMNQLNMMLKKEEEMIAATASSQNPVVANGHCHHLFDENESGNGSGEQPAYRLNENCSENAYEEGEFRDEVDGGGGGAVRNLNEMKVDVDDDTANNNHDNLDYFKYQPQLFAQQHQNHHHHHNHNHHHHHNGQSSRTQLEQIDEQSVWLPRDDLLPPLPTSHPPSNNKHYNQPPPSTSPFTLCNGKELPADLQNINPAFTIRRHIIQVQEEQKQIDALRKAIESKLKVQLPSASTIDELGVTLADGVILCHLVNQIFPRAVQVIHVPSLAMVN